jgi:hypothetical protein
VPEQCDFYATEQRTKPRNQERSLFERKRRLREFCAPRGLGVAQGIPEGWRGGAVVLASFAVTKEARGQANNWLQGKEIG